MTKPFFSIILPTHNGADRICKAIESVTSQTFTNYELIVACDACTDNTEQIVRDLNNPKIRIIKTDCQRDGLARNAGLNAATGEWILFIDDDDYFLHEYCLELLSRQVGKNDEDVLDFAFVWKGKGYKYPSPDETFVMVWCRAWRHTFIGENRFDDSPYGSDKNFFVQMIQENPNVRVSYWNMPMYYYNYLREGSLSWTEKQKTVLDIIITHYDEPWEIGKPFFDMLQHQRCADLDKISVTLVQDGFNHALPWYELLGEYSFHTNIITIPHSGTAAARNAGIEQSHSEWITFFNFDDGFSDICALNLVLKNFPANDYDIIWGKVVQETKWFTSEHFLNCVSESDFSNTSGKLYSRQFLNEHNIRFNPDAGHFYEHVFNALFLSECLPFRIAHMTSEIYPFYKTYRDDTLHHSLSACREIQFSMADRDILLAEEFFKRNNSLSYKHAVAKAIISGYYILCESDGMYQPPEYTQAYLDFLSGTNPMGEKHIDIFREILQSADIDIIRAEVETETQNLTQAFYNEHHLELYFRNASVSFEDWLAQLDLLAATHTASVPSHSQPIYAEPVISEPYVKPQDQTLPTNSNTDHRNEHVVVYCGTFNVYESMIASCKSVLCNLPVDKVYFLVENDTFPYELPDIVQTINVKNQTAFPSDGPNFSNSWTYMCMMRALYPEMFSQYDRILSLDIDIVFNDNVSDLWNYDLSDYYLAGVPEHQRRKSPDDPVYINFGVVLMNLQKLRKDHKQQEIVTMLNTNRIDCPEQTAYNNACAGHILALPNDFNFTPYSHITGDPIKERIIHYAGQRFWKHYPSVKKYADKSWNEVMNIQNKLKGDV